MQQKRTKSFPRASIYLSRLTTDMVVSIRVRYLQKNGSFLRLSYTRDRNVVKIRGNVTELLVANRFIGFLSPLPLYTSKLIFIVFISFLCFISSFLCGVFPSFVVSFLPLWCLSFLCGVFPSFVVSFLCFSFFISFSFFILSFFLSFSFSLFSKVASYFKNFFFLFFFTLFSFFFSFFSSSFSPFSSSFSPFSSSFSPFFLFPSTIYSFTGRSGKRKPFFLICSDTVLITKLTRMPDDIITKGLLQQKTCSPSRQRNVNAVYQNIV
ncbi:unnamed protein product [Acanthosepion pharaonis]|uniref:Uncharacterized protein n=1 Tax=Acanthosepion pharaonis TaxID=158019 RepID=A0A812EPM7_ACAPH|nr:unnamed protein product [Sepia pharaonis]